MRRPLPCRLPGRRLGLGLIAALLPGLVPGLAAAAGLAPLAGAPGALPPAPWVFAGLPDQTLPATRFMLASLDGQLVLRVQAAASYGNLAHPVPGATAGQLSWRWRVDQALPAADLRSRQGDDAALKVCAMFDMPRAAVPFLERQLLRLAEHRTGQRLPSATVCYVWDPAWPAGTVLPNAYTRRVRTVTLGGPLRSWQTVQRDLAADFLRAFGDESPTVPPLLAIAVGADADNTGGESLGYIADLQLSPAAAR